MMRALWIVAVVALMGVVASAAAAALPDHRAYELVSRYEEGGHEKGLNGLEGGLGVPSVNGEAVDWEGLGACCGAASGAVNLFQSYRQGSKGWQTKALTPKPRESLDGLFEEQGPMFFTADLQQTIFATPASFAAGANRPPMNNFYDLYLEGPTGSLTWLTQGPTGTGSGAFAAEFAGATPDAKKVVFNSGEPLTSNATGLETGRGTQYLYMRNVEDETTSLLDVNSSGELLGDEGAALGNGSWLNEDLIPVDYEGTTTHAVSSDGTKVFLESPAPSYSHGSPHLYMRDLANSTTTPMDNPAAHGSARYEGASANGDLAFFTTEEGLDGAPAATQLYEFNTTEHQIGAAPAMSAVPISLGNGGSAPNTTLTAEAVSGSSTLSVASTTGFVAGHSLEVEGESLKIRSVLNATELEVSSTTAATHPLGAALVQLRGAIVGESAMSNDGSRVFFVSEELLATNTNPLGHTALTSQPNLYVYETQTGQTTFVATLARLDVNSCETTCGGGRAAQLVAQPDIARPAYPTHDGSVFVFESVGNLTGQDAAPTTQLSSATQWGEHTLTVQSTAGFLAHHTIAIDTGPNEELQTIESIDSPTQITVSEFTADGLDGLSNEYAVGTTVTQPDLQIYRYATAEHSLSCISCQAPGQIPTGSASLGPSGGGSYAPPGQTVPMNEDGSQIFFESPNPLLEGVQTTPASSGTEARNIYEWKNGQLSLISDGSTAGFGLDGTTPSGNDVFFATRKPLTGAETGGAIDIYDARVEGGSTPLPPEPAPCVAQECRTSTESSSTATSNGTTTFFEAPATATIGGASAPPVSLTAPSFLLAGITASQRAQLARTGTLTLTVTATAPGKIEAVALAKIRGKSRRVATSTATLLAPGVVKVKLQLSKSARAALAAKKTLMVKLEVSYSANGLAKLAVLALHAPPRVRIARRHGAHA
jgi:hypothetical protein